MKANYNRKPKHIREKAVAFRTAKAAFCLVQNTVYDRVEGDKDIVYLDFEDDKQIDKLINTLQELKKRTYEKETEDGDNEQPEDDADESKTES